MRDTAYVTDTHPLIFHVTQARGLSPRARAIFQACDDREAIVFVPAIVLWEVSLLDRIGRIRLAVPLRAFADALFSNPAYQPLPLDREVVALAHEARPNDDPFDALVAASARSLDLPLVTRDAALLEWREVRTVW